MPRPRQASRYLPENHDTADYRQRLAVVADLRRRFALFRRENPRNTRVPGDLRAAVVDAMASGVGPGLLRRTCGLSTSQLARWRMSSRALAPTLAPMLPRAPAPARAQSARVFSVIGETTARPLELSTPPAPAHALELRVGPWSVSVRLAAVTEAMPG